MNNLPTDLARYKVLNTAEAAAFCNFSIPHWRRLYRAKDVPTPLKLSTRKLGWRLGDLIEWLGERAAA